MATCFYDEKRNRWRIQSRVLPRPRSWSSAKFKPSRKPPPEVLAKLAEFEARERALGAAGRKAAGAERDMGLAEWLEGYRLAYGADRRPRSVALLGRCQRRFLAWAAGRKLSKVRDVGRDEARAFAAWLVAPKGDPAAPGGAGLARSSAEVTIALLSGAWTEAAGREEGFGPNPWRLVTPPARRVDPKRPSWTWEEYQLVLPACPPWLRKLVVVGCHTGLRAGELQALRWGWIEWGDARYPWGVLRVPEEESKSKRPREIPLQRAVHDLLAPGAPGKPKAHILTWPGGKPIKGQDGIFKAIRRACEKAGVPFGATHCMRRSFGRWAVQGVGPWKGNPVPMRVVQGWLGHASLTTTETYLSIEERVSDAYMNPPERGD